jgi:hypothetical protein
MRYIFQLLLVCGMFIKHVRTEGTQPTIELLINVLFCFCAGLNQVLIVSKLISPITTPELCTVAIFVFVGL